MENLDDMEKLSDREVVGELLNKIKNKIIFEDQTCYEIENGNYGESIWFDFDKNDNLTNIYT